MKQITDEEIAVLLARATDAEYPALLDEAQESFPIGVKYGIEWQKEQGIDWISVADGLYPPIADKQNENFLRSADVLVANPDKRVDITRAIFSVYNEFVAWEQCSLTHITHWFPINLPKKE